MFSGYINTTELPSLSYRLLVLWNLKFPVISMEVVYDACRKMTGLQRVPAGCSEMLLPIHRSHGITYLKTAVLTFRGHLGHADQKLPNNAVRNAFP